MLFKTLSGLSCAAVVAVAAVAMPAHGQEAKKLIEQAADAIDKAEVITYEAVYQGEGGIKAMLPKIEALVRLRRDDETKKWAVRVSGTSTEPNGTALALEVRWVGPAIEWADVETKRMRRSVSANSRAPEVQFAKFARLMEMDMFPAFGQVLRSGELTMGEAVKVGDVDCQVVRSKIKNQEVVFYLGKDDHFPRKMEIPIQGFGAQMLVLKKFNAKAKLGVEDMDLAIPEGYTPINPALLEDRRKKMPLEATPSEQVKPVEKSKPDKPSAKEGTEVGSIAPDFELKTPDGTPVKLSSLRGNVVVLDFWGTWCAPCKRSSPHVQALHETFNAQPVKVLGLSCREDADKPIAYVKEHGYTYGLLPEADAVARKFRVGGYPTFVVIGKDGEILDRREGFRGPEQFTEMSAIVKEALGSS